MLLAVLVLIQLGGPFKDRSYNADSTYFILLVDDLLSGGGRLADWHLAPHYYFFPDGILSALVLVGQRLGVTTFVASVVLFGAFWIATLALVWRRLSRLTYVQSLPWAAVTLTLALTGTYAVCLPGGALEAAALGFLLFPAEHSGTLGISILCAELTLVLMAAVPWTAKHWLLLAGLVLAVALVTLSDLIFVPWGLVPLAVVLMIQWRDWPPSRLPRVASALLIAVGIGYVLSLALGDEVRGHYIRDLRASVSNSVVEAVRYLWHAAIFASPLAAVIFYGNAMVWVGAALALGRRLAGRQAKPRDQALIFLGALSSVSIVAPAAFGIFRPDMVRIFLPYLFIGSAAFVGFVLLAVIRVFGERRRDVPLVLASGTTLLLAAWLCRGAQPPAAETLVACLAEKHLVTGAGFYWQATPVMLESRQRIHVVPLYQDGLVPMPWMIKRQWLSRDANGKDIALQFAITGADALPEDKVRALFGAPAETMSCGGTTILLYRPAKTLTATE